MAALVVALLALVPVGAGLDGVIRGVAMASKLSPEVLPDLDSHVRYLSGLLVAIGIAFWTTVPDLARAGPRFRLLTVLVISGGIARLLGVFLAGAPSAPMLFGLVMELAVTPLLCLWQMRLAAPG